MQAVKYASLVACLVVLSSFELACAAALLLSTSTLFACSQCVSIALHVGRLRPGEVHADLCQDFDGHIACVNAETSRLFQSVHQASGMFT